MLGVLLADKPQGITSHDAVNRVRRRLHIKRVGHAGTLDPLATGLLVMAVGPATRFLQYLPLEPKEYVGTIRFGISTDSYDAEGQVTAERTPPADLLAALQEVVPEFMGLIDQLPPMYSAVKIQGQPLYKLARQGKEIERETRRVHIGAFDVLDVREGEIDARIECSGGTYVRTLAHEIGEMVGCGAHLAALRRTRVGRFHVNDARPLEEVGPEQVLTLAEALPPMPLVPLTPQQVEHIREGRVITVERAPAGKVALLDPEGRVISVALATGDRLQPECVIPAEAFAHEAV